VVCSRIVMEWLGTSTAARLTHADGAELGAARRPQ
jgi:hypothetical protein